MKSENKTYSDLDLSFIPSPLTGDLNPKVNLEALKRAVRHLFALNAFDVPFNPTIRSNIKRYLFDNYTQLTAAAIDEEIRWVAKKVEPRIEIVEVDIVPTQIGKSVEITVTYRIQSLSQQDSFNFTVERVR